MSELPPLVVAALAGLAALAWQLGGASLGQLVLARSPLGPVWAWPVAWLVWPVATGCAAIALHLVGVRGAAVYSAGMIAVVAGAAVLGWRRLAALAAAAGSPRGWRARLGGGLFAAALAAGVLKLLELVFAAHPQRLYDQLSYHLVTPKRLLAGLDPFAGVYDPHLLLSGPIEFSFAWPAALAADDLFTLAAAQASVFLVVVGAVLLAVWAAAPRPLWILAAFAALVPAVIPDNEIVHIGKPDGMLLAGTFVILALRWHPGLNYPLAAGAVAMVLAACKLTFAHAGIALVLGALALGPAAWRRREVPWGLLALGAACLALVLAKTYVAAGSPLYPADAGLFPSDLADGMTVAYWKEVAFGAGEPFWRRWSGAVVLPGRSPGLVLWLALVAGAGILGWRRSGAATRSASGFAFALTFTALYIALWPLFYRGDIYSRFVAPYSGALLFLSFAALVKAPPAWLPRLTAAAVVLGLAFSKADSMARKLILWNGGTAAAAIARQEPRFDTARLLNARTTPADTVVADDPSKLFFDARVLTGTMTPRQREAWQRLLDAPQAESSRLGVKALVKGPRPELGRPPASNGWVAELWDRLAPYGDEIAVGPDRVLFSSCSFSEKPCPQRSP